jgi:murein DD-endopeptidase MepM/ murein hydrolase activator NlpD
LKINKKNLKPLLIVLFCIVVILPVAWILVVKFEREKPSINIEHASQIIGAKQSIPIDVSDSRSGLRKLWIGLVQKGREVVVLEKEFPGQLFIGGGKEHQASFEIKIEPKEMGMSEGKATLRLVARDFSWSKWWNGNRTYIEKDVIIDTTPPQVDILSRAHNVSQGGSGLVIYKLSEPCAKSGVYVGENFFPGHEEYLKDGNIAMAFFALSYKQGTDTEIYVKATDFGGNSSRAGFPHYLNKRKFKKVSFDISDKFINSKMPEFVDDIPQNSKTSNSDKFLKVNRDLRLSNHRQIADLVKKTDKELYWEGTFLRLPNSARNASFAEHRKYKYKGKVIDSQVHLGIDLASVAHSSIPAANKGKVLFVGSLGIYGKTVIIDHGFGLFSIYSHLSAINVEKGQVVSKSEIIGRTGSSGLAGGDHLHFGILVHDTFVNPIEWWDAAWIKNNITTKIDSAKNFTR